MSLYQTIDSLSNLKGWQLQIYLPYDLYPLLIFPLYFALKIMIMEGPFPRPSHISEAYFILDFLYARQAMQWYYYSILD